MIKRLRIELAGECTKLLPAILLPATRLPAALLLAALLTACSGSDDLDQPLHGSDGVVVARDDGGPTPADEASLAGVDRDAATAPTPDLPEHCPCPADSYCDLATNRCVLGCLGDEYCSAGKFCHKKTKLCRPGCRGIADCTTDDNGCTDLACVDGQCLQRPNQRPCADDKNPCTADVCSGGRCTHPPANADALCGAEGDCASFRCRAGVCVEQFDKAGKRCVDDNDPCTTDSCDGKGACGHTTVDDGTDCPDSWGPNWGAKCVSGKCTPLRYRCGYRGKMQYRLFSKKELDDWDGARSCGCKDRTMKWTSVYYPRWNSPPQYLDHNEHCALCIDDPNGRDACYDFPSK